MFRSDHVYAKLLAAHFITRAAKGLPRVMKYLVRLSLSSVALAVSMPKIENARPKLFLYCHVQRISRGTCPLHIAFRRLRMRLISFCLGWRDLIYDLDTSFVKAKRKKPYIEILTKFIGNCTCQE